MYEEVGQPVVNSEDFCVTHVTNSGAQVAVTVDCDSTALPLSLKYSKHFEEGKAGGGNNVNVNVNTGDTKLVGTKEEREKIGMMREEYILEIKDLTVFGCIDKNQNGLSISAVGCSSISPFIASHKSPNVLIAEASKEAKGLFIGSCVAGVFCLGLAGVALWTLKDELK